MDVIVEAMRDHGARLVYRADRGYGLRYPNGGYSAIERSTYCAALSALSLRIVYQAFGERAYELEQASEQKGVGDGQQR